MERFTLIKQSLKDHLGKPSATRITGYMVSAMLVIMILTVCGAEITKVINDISGYTPSYGFLGMFALLLSHQLVLFNLKKASEKTSFPTLEKFNEGNNVSVYDEKGGVTKKDIKDAADDIDSGIG